MLGSVTTGSATTTGTTTAPTATATNRPSSGNTLHAPAQVVLAIGGGVAVLAQFL
ncbi:hypothetical protein BG000_005552, partial [Podila horticola]